jgi:hypothetical protein
MLFLGIVRRTAAGQVVDLAEEAQSGLGAEASPHKPPPAPRAPAAELTGFALAEPEAPSFPTVEPEPELAPFVMPEREPAPFPEVVPAEPAVLPEAPSFTSTPWARKPTGGFPGDQPVYTPPAPHPPPSEEPAAQAPLPLVPEIVPPPAPASRPTREDLAALDALLSPSASGRLAKSPIERPRPEKWEQQSRPPTTPPRRAPARSVSRARSRVPFIAIGLACILITTVAAWYFFLRTPPPEGAATTPAPPP